MSNQYAFYVDTTRCIKCWACQVTCKQWNGIEAGTTARRTVQELEGDEGQKHLDEYADVHTQRGSCLLKSICEKFGFDSLGYQSLDGLLEAIGLDRDKVCTYCWTGKE